MFKCKKCGVVSPGMKEFKVPSVICKVNYILQIKQENRFNSMDEPILKTIAEKKGFEIVKECIFCSKCIPNNFQPEVLKDEKSRKMIVKRKSRNKFRKNTRDKDEDYG